MQMWRGGSASHSSPYPSSSQTGSGGLPSCSEVRTAEIGISTSYTHLRGPFGCHQVEITIIRTTVLQESPAVTVFPEDPTVFCQANKYGDVY